MDPLPATEDAAVTSGPAACAYRPSRRAIEAILIQHVEDAAALRSTRTVIVRAPHLTLADLQRHDERLAAHLDAIAIADERGWALCEAALVAPGKGELFVAAVRTLESGNALRLARLMMLVEAMPGLMKAFASAFGWVSADRLRGHVKALLDSVSPRAITVGLMACSMHGIDAGRSLHAALAAPDPALRACGLVVAGRGGRLEYRARCVEGIGDPDPNCRRVAAKAGLLLGDRNLALSALADCLLDGDDVELDAFALVMMTGQLAGMRALLRRIAIRQDGIRLAARGAGLAGDPAYVPWLLRMMQTPALARLAGEAFALISGVDLWKLQLTRRPSEKGDLIPSNDPEELRVAMDEDDGLPWPDPEKCIAWWKVNEHRFQRGVRYFLGKPPTLAHCSEALAFGYQRQRLLAAAHLCLLSPGTSLFNTCAPAWRQGQQVGHPGITS